MSLTQRASDDRKWGSLKILRLLLEKKSRAPDYSSSIDYHMIERIEDLLKIHDLCISNLREFHAHDEETFRRISAEIEQIEYQFVSLSKHFRALSNELNILASGISLVSRAGFKSVQKMSMREFLPLRGQFHCLTYAEEGFSPLNQYTKDLGISQEQLKEFAEQVNDNDEIGSLIPIASVTAVPRSSVRDPLGYLELRRHVESFFKENKKSIHAKCLAMDFGTPKVSDAVCQIIELMEIDNAFTDFEKVVFIDND